MKPIKLKRGRDGTYRPKSEWGGRVGRAIFKTLLAALFMGYYSGS